MTGKERVLRLLADGKPHGHMEGYRLGVMLHSRIADLRRDGYRIDCWREGGEYLYQLRPLEEAAGPTPSLAPAVSSSGRATDGDSLLGRGQPAAHLDGQLVLDAPQFRRSAAA